MRNNGEQVRDHYALFVQCAEGLEWLKAYKKGGYITAAIHTIMCCTYPTHVFVVYIPKKQKSLKHIVATAAKEKRGM